MHLERRLGIKVNHKRVQRLMRKMGLRGIVPALKTTVSRAEAYENMLKSYGIDG